MFSSRNSRRRYPITLEVLENRTVPAHLAGEEWLPEDFGGYEGHVVRREFVADFGVTADGPTGVDPDVEIDVYHPEARGAFPLIQFNYGLRGYKRDLQHWGEHLASHGYVVVIPDRRLAESDGGNRSPALDWETRTNDVVRVLSWAVAQDRATGSPLYGRIDERTIGLFGYSDGGFVTLLATPRAEEAGFDPDALVLLDPGGPPTLLPQVKAAAGRTHIPTAVFATDAEPYTHITYPEEVFGWLPAETPKFGLLVRNSSHPGITERESNTLFRRYATAFCEYHLHCQPRARAYLDPARGEALRADEVEGRVVVLDGTTQNLRPHACPAEQPDDQPDPLLPVSTDPAWWLDLVFAALHQESPGG